MTETSSCECPLCDFEDDRTTVYTHLQTAHRKSELSRELMLEECERAVPLRTGTGATTGD